MTPARFPRALNAAGWCHAELGDPAAALRLCREAQTFSAYADDSYNEAATWHSLGHIHQRSGDFELARQAFLRSVGMYVDLGDPFHQADSLTGLGDVEAEAGHPEAARRHWRHAAELLDGLGIQPLIGSVRGSPRRRPPATTRGRSRHPGST